MSMQCWLLSLSAQQAEAVLGSPELAGKLAVRSEMEAAKAARALALSKLAPEVRKEFEGSFADAQSALSDMLGQPPPQLLPEELLTDLGELSKPIELGHFWHVQHFVLSGRADDALVPGNVLMSGHPIGGDVGYGPARLSTIAEVAQAARYLSTIVPEALSRNINLDELRAQNLYGIPRKTEKDPEETDLIQADVLNALHRLQAYVLSAEARRDALLVWIS